MAAETLRGNKTNSPSEMIQVIDKDLRELIQTLSADDLRYSNILISGGAGFIGSWLCNFFVLLGAKVKCIDNLTGSDIRNIRHLLGNSSFKFEQSNVESYLDLSPNYDYVLHLASPVVLEDYTKRCVETLLANSEGTHVMLEIARKCDAKFLYTSSSAIYGSPPKEFVPTNEEYRVIFDPQESGSCYPIAKLTGEDYSIAYNKQYGLDCKIVRIFNTYGPRLAAQTGHAYGRVISNFIVQALRGEDITVHKPGTQTRSFSYISDIVEAISLALTRKIPCNPINIGSKEEISMMELAYKVKGIVGSTSKITSMEPEEIRIKNDVKKRCPDTGRAQQLLGWAPKVDLNSGIAMTVEWFRSNSTRTNP